MAHTIIQKIQEQLGYPTLHKVDPNTQELPEHWFTDNTLRFAQAVIPATLAGIFQQARTDNGAFSLLTYNSENGWSAVLFKEKEAAVLSAIENYTGHPSDEIKTVLDKVSVMAMHLLRPPVDADNQPGLLRAALNSQRHAILVHLPAALQLGQLLNDQTLDDRTNKMEGPMSNLMHRIENNLSGSGN